MTQADIRRELIKDMLAARMQCPDWDASEIRTIPERFAALTVGVTFADLSDANLARCESPEGFDHPLTAWSLSDWLVAATGEFGEAANVAKKLNRVRDGVRGNKRTPEQLAEDLAGEFADAVIYLDLAAQHQGIDLGTAVVETFNRKSKEIGAPHRLGALA